MPVTDPDQLTQDSAARSVIAAHAERDFRSWWADPWTRSVAIVAVITAIGALIRIHRSGDLSLWLDELLTVNETRFPWIKLIGLQGAYDQHPPLYFVLGKLASLLVPEVYAGRLVSLIAGTALIPVVYLLGRRLLNKRTGYIAALCVAFAPVLVWYSQEGRMYMTATLFVGLSYLAFFEAYQSRGALWTALYGFFLWLSMMSDYSAAFALAPHVLLLAYAIARRRSRAPFLIASAATAAVAYAPWLAQALGRLPAPDNLPSYLMVDSVRFLEAVRSTIGVDAANYAFATSRLMTIWNASPSSQVPLLVIAGVVAAGGGLALTRVSFASFLSAVGLTVGTLVMAVLVSVLITPSFAVRTVVYASLGWSLLVAAATSGRVSRVNSLTGTLTLTIWGAAAVAVTASLVTLYQTQANSDKEHWRQLAVSASQLASEGNAVVFYPLPLTIALELYAPDGQAAANRYVEGWDQSAVAALIDEEAPPVVWYAYGSYNGHTITATILQQHGYRLVRHQSYWSHLWLDQYVSPNPAR